MREAKLSGHAVDEPVLAELTKWVAESGDGKTGVPRPARRPKALNAKAVWLAVLARRDPQPDAAAKQGLTRLLASCEERPDRRGRMVLVARNPGVDLWRLGREHDGPGDPGHPPRGREGRQGGQLSAGTRVSGGSSRRRRTTIRNRSQSAWSCGG